MPSPAYVYLAMSIGELAKGNLSEAEINLLKESLDGLMPQGYTISVNYDLTVEQLIEIGKYGGYDKEINSEHFLSCGEGQSEVFIYLMNFNRSVGVNRDVFVEMDRLGLRPANLKELLALGASLPDLQRDNRIVALGSVWDKPEAGFTATCLYINHFDLKRTLDTMWCYGNLGTECRFAAVRK